MSCIKNIYSLFGATGPEYPTDEIWYLGYHAADSSFPYGGAPDDVVVVPPFSEPTISINSGPFIELLSSNFGGFVPVTGHPDNLQGVLLSAQEDLDLMTGEYCVPTVDVDDPYLEDGEPTQPGFYFFLRRVVNEGCIVFSEPVTLQIGVAAYLPEDIQVLRCDTDLGLDCFDITQFIDPAITNTCMYPPYDIDYFDVDDPTCVDVSVAGLYTFTYTVPLSDLGLVFPVDPDCDTCNEDDLTVTIEIIVGPEYEAPPVSFCN